MKSNELSSVSRRALLFPPAAFGLMPHYLRAAPQTLVEKARQSGATAKITTQTLRGNVSALIGSGGNIGVLTGPDGAHSRLSRARGSGSIISRHVADYRT